MYNCEKLRNTSRVLIGRHTLPVGTGYANCMHQSMPHTQRFSSKYLLRSMIYIPNLDPVVSSCCPSSPGDFTSKAKLLPSTI